MQDIITDITVITIMMNAIITMRITITAMNITAVKTATTVIIMIVIIMIVITMTVIVTTVITVTVTGVIIADTAAIIKDRTMPTAIRQIWAMKMQTYLPTMIWVVQKNNKDRNMEGAVSVSYCTFFLH